MKISSLIILKIVKFRKKHVSEKLSTVLDSESLWSEKIKFTNQIFL